MARMLTVLSVLLLSIGTLGADPSFVISGNKFLKDGAPFQILSGSFHYFRVHPAYWNSTFHNMRYAGLNAAQTYIPWNLHEPEPGVYVWDGFADVIQYLKLAQANDLLVVLRLGPYVCGEWEYGGFPYWLMKLYPNFSPRSSDANYLYRVDIWWNQLLPLLKPYLYSNGGPVILAQIENEYGDYGSNKVYLTHLRDKVISYFGNNSVIIHSTDPASSSAIDNSYIPGVYQTVDFSDGHDVNTSFATQHLNEPNTPDMNSEYYTDWFVGWNLPTSASPTKQKLTSSFDAGYSEMLSVGASINMYMFRGSTNFGYMNGASGDDSSYVAVIPSYYAASPLSEAGDPAGEYSNIRTMISKYYTVPNWPAPVPSPKGNYGAVKLSQQISLFDALSAPFAPNVTTNAFPQTFEELGLAYGYILYHSDISAVSEGNQVLSIPNYHDRATVFVDRKLIGVLQRSFNTSLTVPKGVSLDVLVENQGRISHGKYMKDWKGIQGNVTLGGKQINGWTMSLLPFADLSKLSFSNTPTTNGPTIYQGSFTVSGTPYDTYLNTAGWRKGIAIVNGFNVGRFWAVGPQHTLYVPAPILRQGENEVIIFEAEETASPTISFQDSPICSAC